MKVLFSPEVQRFYNELEIILYEKGYFSYEESANIYVDDLIFDIKNNLPKLKHKPAPQHYNKYGKALYYATFTKSKRTHWYVFFSKYIENGETIYLICYLGNNHTEAHHL